MHVLSHSQGAWVITGTTCQAQNKFELLAWRSIKIHSPIESTLDPKSKSKKMLDPTRWRWLSFCPALDLTGALSSIIQRSTDEAQIEALKTQLQEVEQEAMMRTHQGERRLRAEIVEEFQSFESHQARLLRDRRHGSDANAQAEVALIQGNLEAHHEHLVQQMRQSIDFDSTQARQIMVSEVNHEVAQMCSATHSEYQAAVSSEKRELYSEFQDRLNQKEMTVDAKMQAERQMVQVERRAMQASQQRLGGEQSDELHKLRAEWTVYQNTEVREVGELRMTANKNYVEFHTCQQSLYMSEEKDKECFSAFMEARAALADANHWALSEHKEVIAWQQWGQQAQVTLEETDEAQRAMKKKFKDLEQEYERRRKDKDARDALGRRLETPPPPGLYEFQQEPAKFHSHASPLRQAPAASAPPPHVIGLKFAGFPITAESKTLPQMIRDQGLPAPAATAVVNSGDSFLGGDSSKESNDEAFRRKRANVSKLELEPPPTAGGLRNWLSTFYLNVCSASNRSKKRTMRYIASIINAPSLQAVETVSTKWDDPDTEIGKAVMKISAGAVRRELLLYSEARRQVGASCSGRAFAYMFLRRYDLDRGQVFHVDLTALVALECKEDLESYLDNVDYVLLGMSKMPDENLLHAIVIPQLRKSKALQPEFVSYDRAPEGSDERTAQYMLDASRQVVSRRRRADTRASMLGSKVQVSLPDSRGKGGGNRQEATGKAKTKAGKAKSQGRKGGQKICPFFLKGKCKWGGNCDLQHSQVKVDKAKGAGKGKGAEKADKPKKVYTTAERHKMAQEECTRYKAGNCDLGDKCFRQHGLGDEPLARLPCLIVQMPKTQESNSEGRYEQLCLDTGTGVW